MNVQYWGTPNYNEFPLTGVLRLWTNGQKQDVPDAIAARLIGAGVGFAYDSDNAKGENATWNAAGTALVNPLTGGDVSFEGGGGLPIIPTTISPLTKWRLALAKSRAGISPAKIVMLGDSTTLGSGGTGTSGYQSGTRAVSPAVKLATQLSSFGLNTRSDSIFGSGSLGTYGTNYDPRFVYDAGWSSSLLLNASYGGTFRGNANGAVMTVTPTKAWTHAKVWYAQAASQGNMSLSASDATTVPIVGNGANALASATLVKSGSASLSPLVITKTNATTNYVLGVEFWDSSLNDIRIVQMGASGAKAGDFAASANPWDGLNELTALAPDLTILNLAINDWNAATATGTFTTAIQSWITAAKVTGDVLIMTGYPTAAATTALATQQTYVDILVAQAGANAAVLDSWRRLGSYETAGSFYADTLHPNGFGYSDAALSMAGAVVIA